MMNPRLILGLIVFSVVVLSLVIPFIMCLVRPTTPGFMEWLSNIVRIALRYSYEPFTNISTFIGISKARHSIQGVEELSVKGSFSRIIVKKGVGVVELYGVKTSTKVLSSRSAMLIVTGGRIDIEVPKLKKFVVEGHALSVELGSVDFGELLLHLDRGTVEFDGSIVEKKLCIELRSSIAEGHLELRKSFSKLTIRLDGGTVDLDLRLPADVGLQISKKSVNGCIVDVEERSCVSGCIIVDIECRNGIIDIDVVG